MSIISSYDESSEAIVSPDKIVSPIENFPEKVLVVFYETFAELLLARFDTEVISYLSGGRRIPVYQFTYQGNRIAFYHSIVGGAGAAGLLEDVIAMGGKKFLFFGSCGALDEVMTNGNMIVPTAAYRDEGLSYHYMKAGNYIEVSTAARMAEILSILKVPYVKTRTWTTDGIYRETRRNAALRKSEGCGVVEMECASVMAVGKYRHVAVYQLLYTADSLDGEEWEERTLQTMPKDASERIFTIAMEVVIRL